MKVKNQKVGKSFLPFIKPTFSSYVWEFDQNYWHKKRSGVYVFWDWVTANRKDFNQRFKLDYPHLPLYIGKADNLEERVIKHIKGKNHTKAYAPYFYYVDIYDFEEIYENCISNLSMPGEQYGRLRDLIKNNQFTAPALTDLYEVYFIMRRIPIFNKQSNHFVSENLHKVLLKNNYHLYLHRRFWSQYECANNKKPKRISPGSTDSVEKLFKLKKISLDLWCDPKEFSNQLIAKWSIKDEGKKEFLKKHIQNQVTYNSFPSRLFTKGVGSTYNISLESTLFYELLGERESFETLYKNHMNKK